jgi:CheY-like chemotaxis protein
MLALLPPGSEKAPAAIAIIERQVSQLARVVDDLLDVTRIARGKIRLQRARIEVGDLVRRTVEDHRAGLEEKHIQVGCDTGAAPLWVDADASRLAQVLGNLLGNALKFTDAGGRVQVVLGREAGWMLLRVRDTGVGIAKEIAGRLFEPFTQGPQAIDRSRGGLGLGLSTAKGLVELHGGTVEVASAGVGHGAEFTVRIPLASPIEVAAPPAAGPPAPPRRVLVIDDNADAAETLKDLLELRGHSVRVALDGPSALRAARAFQPDVVLCDIGLPGMSGYDVARALRADDALRHALLVALSGYAQPEDARRAAEAGFDRHVAKPAGAEEIERLLAKGPRRSADTAGATAE